VLLVFSADEQGAAAVAASSSTANARVIPFRYDLTEADAPGRVFDAAEQAGDPVVLVNNAAITGPIGPFAEVTDETLRSVVDLDLIATMRLSREAVARWRRLDGKDRSIVNVSSMAAKTGSPGEYVWYAAAKAGVNAFTVGLAAEVARSGIRVNGVNPGTTDTSIHERAGKPQRAAEIGARSPMGRPATADEVAAAIEWLTTADASYVAGTILDVSGGTR
jgi:NAD(P)-dependent dehydrogenase (short-subunit alcohol dehydrogenase family)